jgi:hypothetical protein
MTAYFTACAVSWALENRVDATCDPCDDCTHWIGEI